MAYPKPHKARDPKKGVPMSATDDDVLKAIKLQRGNMTRVADTFSVARSTIHDRIQRNPILKQALLDERERFVDELEDACEHLAVNDKDTTLKIFMLKTRARARGYEQDMNPNATQDIAKAAFDFVLNRTANPAES